MANNYVQVSFVIPCKDEQADILITAEKAERERRENGEDCLECFGANFDRLPGVGVHIYDDESANVEALVELLRDWVRRTGYTEPIAFEWAVTSSCPRPGEFGGGAVVIYNDETTWLSTMQWMKDVAQEKMEAA